ncbi:MAG: two-component system, OmpR family, sensor histidine kinase BaeS [Gaiellales bacterium]|nr:two-component system, OmpR family, sensor histidine kinase BaeS [Gaiellales bacterium]
MRAGRHGRRPPWWPAEQQWPPERRRPSHRFVLRIALMLSLVLLTLAAIMAAGVWAALVAVGAISASWGVRAAALLVLVGGVACFLVLGRTVGRRMAPIGALIEAAAQIEHGDYSARVSERGGREVRSLARAFNTMSARLGAIDSQRRSFLADVAHELRTPLAIMRGRLEAMLDGIHPRDDDHLRAILEHAASLERLVGDVATVALAETGGLALHLEQVDLAVLAHAVAEDYAEAARDAEVELCVRAHPDATPIEVDPARIRQALANLVANALRYSAPGGRVVIAVERGPNGTAIAVHDDGSGIPEALLDHVFERFVRDPDSTGSGLGLPIVADIAAAHGGSATATSSPGEGTTVTVLLP